MKRVVSVISVVLFTLYSVVPFGSLIALLIDYSFSLRNYTVSAVVMAVISAIAVIIALFDKNKEASRLTRVFMLLTLMISIPNWLCYILLSEWKFTCYCMAVCFVCALIYMIKYAQSIITVYATALICTLIFIPLCFISFFDYILGGFDCNTTVQTIYSPDEKYKAEVIDSNSGAKGGDTLVYVYNNKSGIDLYVLRIFKKPQCVYTGDWGAYINMTIYWKDDHTLLINGVTYPIDQIDK